MRVLRVCSEEYLCYEWAYIMDALGRLRYPLSMVFKLKRKAEENWRRKDPVRRENDFLVVLLSKRTALISHLFAGVGLRVIPCAGKRTKDIVGRSQKKKNSIIYKNP